MRRHQLFFLFLILVLQNASAGEWIQKASFGGTGRHRASGCSTTNKGYMGLGHVNGAGSNISYNDVTGSYTGTVPTDNITLVTRFSSSFVQVTASAATNNWVIKGMIRCI